VAGVARHILAMDFLSIMSKAVTNRIPASAACGT
jgi:hypothetical protein